MMIFNSNKNGGYFEGFVMGFALGFALVSILGILVLCVILKDPAILHQAIDSAN